MVKLTKQILPAVLTLLVGLAIGSHLRKSAEPAPGPVARTRGLDKPRPAAAEEPVPILRTAEPETPADVPDAPTGSSRESDRPRESPPEPDRPATDNPESAIEVLAMFQLASSKDAGDRVKAANWFGHHPSPEAIQWLKWMVDGDTSTDVRSSALHAMGYSRDVTLLDYLRVTRTRSDFTEFLVSSTDDAIEQLEELQRRRP